FVLATRANAEAQHTTHATVLAMQKMEELRATPLPLGVVDAVDYADSSGVVLTAGAASRGAVYERRWIVEPLPTGRNAVVITVTVTRRGSTPAGGRVRLITLRSGGRVDTEAPGGGS
ncbi:MAG: type IV pilus modification PilV family protein, partial [Vicinamibacterales bacterium]